MNCLKRGLFIFAMFAIPLPGFAQVDPKGIEQSLLSAFVSYTDLRIGSIQQWLETLASTDEVGSGNWEKMHALLAGGQELTGGLAVWFAHPDGSYYTTDKGLMDVKLIDRSYFADLMAGQNVIGALVVSKSTGMRSAVIAVPVRRDGVVVGAIGASVFLDVLSDQVNAALALPEGAGFFVLAPDGRTVLHPKKDRHLLDPRDVGSDTLVLAANEILSRPSGETTYDFDLVTKRAIYRTSPLTQWKFAISVASEDAQAD